MKLMIMDRGMGKTTKLIHTSEVTGYPIVASTHAIAENIKHQAKEFNCKIPEPITVQDILHGKLHGRYGYENVLIDEVCLNGLLKNALNSYLGCNVVACTCSPDYTWEEKQEMCNKGLDGWSKRNISVSC